MILLLVIAACVWMLLLWLAAGLCAAARLGDRTRVGDDTASTISLPVTQRLAA
jgi:hypothetical protein